MQIIWFKRDLRIHHHIALTQAARMGPVLPLYILEPELWQQPDMSERHYLFLRDSLRELYQALRNLGQHLVIKVGDAVSILAALHQRHGVTALWSHQETWNGWTYTRDKNVGRWADSCGVQWLQPPQNGVIRCLKSRNGWAAQWYKKMNQPLCLAPNQLQPVDEASDPFPLPEQLGLTSENDTSCQPGGRAAAIQLLNSFLFERGQGYTKDMSSPLTAFDSCSRLSAHIAFGTVSVGEIFHALEQRKRQVKLLPLGARGKWPSALRSFAARLRWHCHFIQKLEDEPQLEFENLHSAFNNLREPCFNDEYFQAWKAGKTGYPMIDACMRALTATGWINFRMRAMLVSFASYHLWLHWRQPALHLAKLFVDYEPGIHYAQMQMQSGTTGINSLRIYNPLKQGLDQDPDGVFVRKWLPELAHMPSEHIHKPWQQPSKMNHYPLPIVDEKTARESAAAMVYPIKEHADNLQETRNIVTKHASRKTRLKPKKKSRTRTKKVESSQEEFPF